MVHRYDCVEATNFIDAFDGELKWREKIVDVSSSVQIFYIFELSNRSSTPDRVYIVKDDDWNTAIDLKVNEFLLNFLDHLESKTVSELFSVIDKYSR